MTKPFGCQKLSAHAIRTGFGGVLVPFTPVVGPSQPSFGAGGCPHRTTDGATPHWNTGMNGRSPGIRAPERAPSTDHRLQVVHSIEPADKADYSRNFSRLPISPTIPRRNARTQMMKMTPCVTVTQAPNSAR